MKTTMPVLAFLCFVLFPGLSFSKDFQKEYDKKMGPTLDALHKSFLRLHTLSKDLDKVISTAESVTYKQMAAYQKIGREIDLCRLIVYYERELLSKTGGLCNDMYILYTYKHSKERYRIRKNDINKAYIQGIKNMYGNIESIAALHLIDKAVQEIEASLRLLDTCFDIFKSVLPEGELVQIMPDGTVKHHDLK